MLAAQHHSPTVQETFGFFTEFLDRRLHLLQVSGELEIFYTGRAQSTAEAGDYLLTIKPDGCLMIHGAQGIKPRNWQPTTDSITARLEEDVVVVTAERHTPREVLRVRLLSCDLVQAFCLREETSFLLSGSEADMQAALRQRPDLIEPGLCLIDSELPTGVGSVDIFARDSRGNLVVIELKRGKATHEGVHQLARYVQKVKAHQTPGVGVRGILVAPDATRPALKCLTDEGLEYKQLTALPTLQQESPQATLF